MVVTSANYHNLAVGDVIGSPSVPTTAQVKVVAIQGGEPIGAIISGPDAGPAAIRVGDTVKAAELANIPLVVV
jgi:hypothetical protein